MKLLISLALCIIATLVSGQKQYCGLKSCGKIAHLACNHKGWATTCPSNRRMMTLNIAKKNLIVRLHNRHRNKIALGRERGFKTATRMTTMTWDDDLAHIASLNVMQCYKKHDTLCINTLKYSTPGQNLAINSTALNAISQPVSIIVTNMINSWYSEVNNADQNTITNCCGAARHFTQMIQANSNRVGCALAIYKSKRRTTELFACNYSRGNTSPVYVVGKTAKKCTKGRNPHFTGLCHPNEIV